MGFAFHLSGGLPFANRKEAGKIILRSVGAPDEILTNYMEEIGVILCAK
jgi:hypothetical protein